MSGSTGSDRKMRKRRSLFGRFAKSRKGAAAIEFALVSAPFFALLLSIMEIGILFLKITVVENAVTDATRYVRTGQAQAQELNQDEFVDYICGRMNSLIRCNGNVTAELVKIKNFNDIPKTAATCRTSSDVDDPDSTIPYELGGTGDVVFARICVTVPIYTPGMGIGLDLPRIRGDNFAIVSQLVFRNEPYAGGT